MSENCNQSCSSCGEDCADRKEAKTDFRDKVNDDKNLDNSKLKAFVEKMCQEGAKPSYNKCDKEKGLK